MTMQALITFQSTFHVVPRTTFVLHPHLDQFFSMLLVETTIPDVLDKLTQMYIPTFRRKANVVRRYDIRRGNFEVSVDFLVCH